MTDYLDNNFRNEHTKVPSGSHAHPDYGPSPKNTFSITIPFQAIRLHELKDNQTHCVKASMISCKKCGSQN